MKAAPILKAILQEDVVQASEAPLEADEYKDVIFALNNFMFELAADGVNIGWTEVTGLSSEVTVPRGAINGIIKNMALQIAIQFDVPVPVELQRQADSGMRVLEKIAVSIPVQSFPSTLPIGSGNECNTNTHFYGEGSDTLLTEQGLVIAPEQNTGVP